MITCQKCKRDCTGDAVVREQGWLCRPCSKRPVIDSFAFFLVTLAVAAVVAMVTIVVALCTRGL